MFERRTKAFREAAGLTLEQVGAEIGVSGHTVDSWERKGKVPAADSFMRMARLYGRKAEEFFDETSMAPPGFSLAASIDVPEPLRKEAVRLVRELNKKYRASKSGEHAPVEQAPARRLKVVRDP